MLTKNETIDGTSINGLAKGSDKKVETKCDTCGSFSTTTYHNYCLSQEKKNWSRKTYCKKCASRLTGYSKKGTPAWNKGQKLPPEKRGRNSPSWKGGTYIDAHGYRMLHNGSEKHLVGWNNYSKEHTIVMEKEIARKLEKKEVIHHIDGDKLLNVISNLWLTNHKGHRLAHQSLQEIGYILVKAGFIRFDKQSGVYVADIKLRELLESPEVGNQQPSPDSNVSEGSTTRSESLRDNKDPRARN
jgi:hypothetical protein